MSDCGIIIDVEQGTDRWKQLRCGKITASRTKDATGGKKVKGEWVETAARAEYRMEIMIERLTNVPVPQYVSKDMLWGLQQEPFARAAYELHAGVFVDTVGFVVHPRMPYFGCSPDGFVGDDGMIQIKCPALTTHFDWLTSGVIPVEHIWQMCAELAVTGREWGDFVSYHPYFPEHLQLFVRRYHRDEKCIVSMEAEIAHFNTECGQMLERLPGAPQLAAAILDVPKADEMEF